MLLYTRMESIRRISDIGFPNLPDRIEFNRNGVKCTNMVYPVNNYDFFPIRSDPIRFYSCTALFAHLSLLNDGHANI